MRHFAIAAGHQVTARAAEEALRAGGTAVDAVIAGGLAACVAEPILAGLLGGGFLLVLPAGGRPALLDFFVQTPKRRRAAAGLDFRAVEADFGETTQAFHIGAGAIATPGFVPGLAEAHARHGRMPLADLAQPAIRAAREGVVITPFQAAIGRIVAPVLCASPSARSLMCGSDGAPLPAGAVYRNPELADVLEVLGQEGPRFISKGEVAAALLALTGDGGHLTREDLRAYRPEWRRPLERRRGEAHIALNPPPASGGALIAFALELIGPAAGAPAIARAFEATCRARLEARLSDDPEAGAARLLDPALLARYRDEVLGRPAARRGTTHISVIDGTGMAAALSISNGEGCGVILPGTGIMPNNMLGEADLVPADPPSWTPDTRLSSMMTPLAVRWPDGALAVMGSGGSNRIRTALAKVLVNLTDRQMTLADAIEAPRLHVEPGEPPAVDYELPDLPEAEREALAAAYPRARGWPERSMFFGGVHAVLRDARGGLGAAGDPRRDGFALTSSAPA